MKFYSILSLLSLFIIGTLALNNDTLTGTGQTPPENTKNTYLVTTKLTKKQLETLLKDGKVQAVSLKKKKNLKKTVLVQENGLNSTANSSNNASENSVQEVEEDDLFKEIENEVKEESLNPIDEFHVKGAKNSATPGTTTLVAKKEGKFFCFLSKISLIFSNTWSISAFREARFS